MILSSIRIEWYICWPRKVKVKGWPQVTWPRGHHVYHSMRLDELNTMRPSARLYLVPVRSYCQKTAGDLWWRHMTSQLPNSKTDLKVVKVDRIWSHVWYMGPFRPVLVVKTGSWFFPHWLIMGRSRNWPDLRSPISKFRDIQIVATNDLITSCDFQRPPTSTVALARWQSCKKVTWGWVIQSDLVTWP